MVGQNIPQSVSDGGFKGGSWGRVQVSMSPAGPFFRDIFFRTFYCSVTVLVYFAFDEIYT